MEAKARAILAQELSPAVPATDLGRRIHDRFRGLHDIPLELPTRGERIRIPDVGCRS